MEDKKWKDKAKSEILLRYFRKVQGYPEGKVVHHADCGIFAAYLGICTCGLHHDLKPLDIKTIDEIDPLTLDDKSKDGVIMDLLRRFEQAELYVPCPECKGTGWKEKETWWEMISSLHPPQCPTCRGTRVVLYSSPEPCPDDVFDDLMKELFKNEDTIDEDSPDEC